MQLLLQVLNKEPKGEVSAQILPGMNVDGETPETGDLIFADLVGPPDARPEGVEAGVETLPVVERPALPKSAVELTEAASKEPANRPPPAVALDTALPSKTPPPVPPTLGFATGAATPEITSEITVKPGHAHGLQTKSVAPEGSNVSQIATADKTSPISAGLRPERENSLDLPPERPRAIEETKGVGNPRKTEGVLPTTSAHVVSKTGNAPKQHQDVPARPPELPVRGVHLTEFRPKTPGQALPDAPAKVPPETTGTYRASRLEVSAKPQAPADSDGTRSREATGVKDAPLQRPMPEPSAERLAAPPMPTAVPRERPLQAKASREVQSDRAVEVRITAPSPAPQPDAPLPSQQVQTAPLVMNEAALKDRPFNPDHPLSKEDSLGPLSASDKGEARRISDPTMPRIEPNARPVITQLVQAARSAIDGMVEVKLSPEELGRVRLAMTTAESGMTVLVTAERPETLDLIRRNIDIFAADLTEQGFTDLNFSFGDEGDREQTDAGETVSAKSAISDGPVVFEGRMDMAGHTTDGRVDIRL